MRRLYVPLAAALIAASLVALPVASASAITKRYMAIAVAPSVVGARSAYGHTKARAKRKAMTECKRHYANDPHFRHDCKGAVWVRLGPYQVQGQPYCAEGLPPLRQGGVRHAVQRPFAKPGLGRYQGRPLVGLARSSRAWAAKNPGLVHRGA